MNTADYTVAYESPSQGLITIGWEGPFIVDGEQIDLGPYPRWDNAYCLHEFDTNPTVITFGPQRLELDFEEITRKYWLD